MRTQLAKGQIAAEHRDSLLSECVGQRDQQRRVAVGSGAVREDEAVGRSLCGNVQESADGNFSRRRILERPNL